MPLASLKAADESLLSDRVSVVSRWKDNLCNLLNHPLHDPPDVLVAEAEAAILDSDIDTYPHYLGDVQGHEEKLPVQVAYSRSTSAIEVVWLCRH